MTCRLCNKTMVDRVGTNLADYGAPPRTGRGPKTIGGWQLRWRLGWRLLRNSIQNKPTKVRSRIFSWIWPPAFGSTGISVCSPLNLSDLNWHFQQNVPVFRSPASKRANAAVVGNVPMAKMSNQAQYTRLWGQIMNSEPDWASEPQCIWCWIYESKFCAYDSQCCPQPRPCAGPTECSETAPRACIYASVMTISRARRNQSKACISTMSSAFCERT